MPSMFERLEIILDLFIDKVIQEHNLTDEQLDKLMPDLITTSSTEVAKQLGEHVKKYAKVALPSERASYAEFQQELLATWGTAIDLLEILEKSVFTEGNEFIALHQIEAATRNNYVFECLRRLHAIACLTATEIIHLLKGGFASGAMARWRALHEIAVTALFISEQGEEVAERYLAHEIVETYKAALHYREWFDKYAATFDPPDYDPLSDEDFAKLKTQYDSVSTKYGKAFRENHNYGWAADALAPKSATFSEIELAAGQDEWRPYYRLSNYSIHAGVKGATFNIGIHSNDVGYILSGPSMFGLADPGQLAARSLYTVARALFMCYPSLQTVITRELFAQLVGEISIAFGEAHQLLEAQNSPPEENKKE